jgi:hypothetical protein
MQGDATVVVGIPRIQVGCVGVGEIGVELRLIFFVFAFLRISVVDKVELLTEVPLVEIAVIPGWRSEK